MAFPPEPPELPPSTSRPPGMVAMPPPPPIDCATMAWAKLPEVEMAEPLMAEADTVAPSPPPAPPRVTVPLKEVLDMVSVGIPATAAAADRLGDDGYGPVAGGLDAAACLEGDLPAAATFGSGSQGDRLLEGQRSIAIPAEQAATEAAAARDGLCDDAMGIHAGCGNRTVIVHRHRSGVRAEAVGPDERQRQLLLARLPVTLAARMQRAAAGDGLRQHGWGEGAQRMVPIAFCTVTSPPAPLPLPLPPSEMPPA